MLRTASRAVAAPSIVPAAIRCNSFPLSLQQKLLQVVLTLHPNGHRKWLQRTTGRSPRTCDYWLAGETVMGGAAVLAIVCALRAEIDRASDTLKQFELDFLRTPA